jgi:hypothetical protein
MPKVPLFTNDEAADAAYSNIRAARNSYSQAARQHCEQLWELFEPHADPEFRIEIRANFDARYWEMYLTVCLLELGYAISCPKPGPDIGMNINGQRVWFEATSPNRGASNSPDRVPDLIFGEAQDVPNEKMVLRYLNSISYKCLCQFSSWLKNGIVSSSDAFVIALNPRNLGFDYADTEPPTDSSGGFHNRGALRDHQP